MRNFNNRYRLIDAEKNIKILYTLFLGTLLLGIIITALWSYSKTGLTYIGVVRYYTGFEEKLIYPKEFQELAETTHFHLFSMPIIFLTLCHVLYLTSITDMTKRFLTFISFGGVILDIVSPWLIRYVALPFALGMFLGDIMMALGIIFMTVIPIYEMWIKHTGKIKDRKEPQKGRLKRHGVSPPGGSAT